MNRIKELFVKLISVKGCFVIVTTVAYFVKSIDFNYVLTAWTIFIGSREALKIISSLKRVS